MTKLWMAPSEWEHLVPKSVGKDRANHIADYCSGGSKSMIVERKSNGDISAHCFRCGGVGFVPAVRHYSHPAAASAAVPSSTRTSAWNSYPPDATGEWGRFSPEARRWLVEGGVTSVISDARGVQWSDSTGKLYLPVTQGSRITTGHKNVGWVERGFSPKSYYTRVIDKENFYGYYPQVDAEVGVGNICVLVEDVISGWRCSEVVDTFSIMGVHPSPALIGRVLKERYREAVVFLDGDNPTVRMKAREIGKRLPFVRTRIVETGQDPKSYSREELARLLLTTS